MQTEQNPQKEWLTSRSFILTCILSFLLGRLLSDLSPDTQQHDTPQTEIDIHPNNKTKPSTPHIKAEIDPDDVHATSLLLARAERQPDLIIEILSRMELPWAKSWAGFLLVATHPNDAAAMAQAIRLQEEARIAMEIHSGTQHEQTLTAEEALVEVRLIGEDTPDSREVPCWIARRWPSAWVEAFDAMQGSSRDGYLPQCDPPLNIEWMGNHTQVATQFLGPYTGFCGSLAFAERRTAFVVVFRAWYLPRTLLTTLESRRNYRIEIRNELLEALDGNLALQNDYIKAVQPSATWRRRLQKHLYTKGLSQDEANSVVEATEATIEGNMISSELRCGRETH